MPAFSETLRALRDEMDLTQAEFARLAGVAPATVTSYEGGRRLPGRSKVIEIADRLGWPAATTNSLLESLGHEPVPAGRMTPLLDRRKPLSVLQQECSTYPWPCLINNENFEIVGWNDAANDLSELDFAVDLAAPGARHLVRMAATDHYRQRLLNWDEVIGLLVSMYKNDRMNVLAPAEGTAYFNALVAYLAQHHQEVLLKLYQLWESTPVFEEGVRITFPAEWRTGDGTSLRFNCVVTDWSDFDAAWAFDWHPADAETWRWLEAARERRLALPLEQRPLAFNPSLATWRDLLHYARQSVQMSRATLAARSGVAQATIYAYEKGKREPVRDTIIQLVRAMELDGATTNAILSAAGLRGEPSDFSLVMAGEEPRASLKRFPSPRSGVSLRASWEAIRTAVEPYRWPCMVVDAMCDLRILNPLARRVLQIDETQLSGIDCNLLAIFASAQFRACVPNWLEVASAILPNAMLPYMERAEPGARQTYLAGVARSVGARNPEDLESLERIIREFEALDGRALTVRSVFPLIVRDGDDELHFNGVLAPWSSWDSKWAIDLHPADAATWELLERKAASEPRG